MRNPNTQCSVCNIGLYRRPRDLKKWTRVCCNKCKGILYKNHPEIWNKNLSIGHGWNKGLSKDNGDQLTYGKPRLDTTKQLISNSLKNKPKSIEHRVKISIARLDLYDVIGRKIPRSAKYNSRYQRWRRMVLSRDNYTCCKCGSKERLETHHIKSFRHYPELRYELSNGLTLCNSCHRQTSNYGFKRNVILQ